MRVALTGGAYSTPGLIGAAQRCVNLYPETVPRSEGEPAPVVHVQTPGLRLLVSLGINAPVRGLYVASNGDLYAVAGSTVLFLDAQFHTTPVATLTTSAGPVSMRDNTLTLVVVDGSKRGDDPTSLSGGVQIDLASRGAAAMPTEADGFYGADWVDYVATFLVFNKPGTPQFYVSDSLATTFTALYFANKSGAPDYLVAPVAARGLVWLLGRQTSEVWSLSGAADFPFQQLSGALIEHGCMAAGSIARSDGAIFMLSGDRAGRGVVLKTAGLQMERISNHAIEAAIAAYAAPEKATAFCYQESGHSFYVLSFAEATWAYDEATQDWHERAFGAGQRHLASCCASAYGQIVVGDYRTAAFYALDPAALSDAGTPIRCIRSFPHFVEDDDRVRYSRFIADLSVANGGTLQLRWSDDRGVTFGNPLTQSMGASGDTYRNLAFWRLGMARDRVFEVSWDAAAGAALIGAFVEAQKGAT